MNYIKDFYGQNEFIEKIKDFLKEYRANHLHEPYMLECLEEPSFINFNELYDLGEKASELVEVKRISDSENMELPALYKLKKGGFAFGYIQDALMDYDNKRWITFNSIEELKWKYPVYEERCDEEKGYTPPRRFTPEETRKTREFLCDFFEVDTLEQLLNDENKIELCSSKGETFSLTTSFVSDLRSYNSPIRNVRELNEFIKDYSLPPFKENKFNEKLNSLLLKAKKTLKKTLDNFTK